MNLKLLAGALLAMMFNASAHAGEVCDVLELTGDHDEAVIGALSYRQCSPNPQIGCYYPPAGNRYGACVRSRSTPTGAFSAWRLVALPGCDGAAIGDVLAVQAGAGNDRVAAMQVDHYPRDQVVDFTCRELHSSGYWIYGAIKPLGDRLALDAEMGTGSDRFYGSDNADVAASNSLTVTFSGGVLNAYTPADRANDTLCGYWGDDWLYGDDDDGLAGAWPNIGFYSETLDGGGGSRDVCFGDRPPALVAFVAGEAQTDSADVLGCEMERYGKPSSTPSASTCAPSVVSPFYW